MQRQRDGLVPIGDALSDLGGPVQTIRAAGPPPQRGFTLADQVHQLVGASEADADLGFIARLMALCSLPHTNPGNRLQYVPPQRSSLALSDYCAESTGTAGRAINRLPQTSRATAAIIPAHPSQSFTLKLKTPVP